MTAADAVSRVLLLVTGPVQMAVLSWLKGRIRCQQGQSVVTKQSSCAKLIQH